MNHDEQQTLQHIAKAGADALDRWRASKQNLRTQNYRRRMQQVKEPKPVAWLQAVDRDDQADEHEPMIEEQAA